MKNVIFLVRIDIFANIKPEICKDEANRIP